MDESKVDESVPHEENIRVVCRFRPVRPQELHEEKNHKSIDFSSSLVINEQSNKVSVKNSSKVKRSQDFNTTFDDILSEKVNQEQTFERLGKPLVAEVVKGYNCTIFAYGQTGSGKTYSMFGNENYNSKHAELGLIPRSLFYLYELLNNDNECIKYIIKVSVLEIYKERLRDLIDIVQNKRLIIFTVGKLEIKNLAEKVCTTHTSAIKCIVQALSNRKTRTTGFIDHESSRSHCMVIVSVQQFLQNGSSKFSKLQFGDLAGSEKQRKTNSGKSGTQEAGAIHKGLLALQKVIRALTSGDLRHVPYRDSPLTKILEGSLGGNSKTTLLVTCTPHLSSIDETKSTLMFAKNCKKIKNLVEINRVRTVGELEREVLKLKAQVKVLKVENRQLKKSHNSNANGKSKSKRKNKNENKKSKKDNELVRNDTEMEESLILNQLREREEELLQLRNLMSQIKNDSLRKQQSLDALQPQLEDREKIAYDSNAQNVLLNEQLQEKDKIIADKDEIIRQLQAQLQSLQQTQSSTKQRPSLTIDERSSTTSNNPLVSNANDMTRTATVSVMNRVHMLSNAGRENQRISSSDSDNDEQDGKSKLVSGAKSHFKKGNWVRESSSWMKEAQEDANSAETANNVTDYLRKSFVNLSFKPASHSVTVGLNRNIYIGSKYNRDGSLKKSNNNNTNSKNNPVQVLYEETRNENDSNCSPVLEPTEPNIDNINIEETKMSAEMSGTSINSNNSTITSEPISVQEPFQNETGPIFEQFPTYSKTKVQSFESEVGPIIEQQQTNTNTSTNISDDNKEVPVFVEDVTKLKIGTKVDGLDSSFFWYSAQIIEIDLHHERAIKIKYDGFEQERWQEWIPFEQRYRIATHKSRSFGNSKLQGGVFAISTTSYSMNIHNNHVLLLNGFSQLDYIKEHIILYRGYMEKRGGLNTAWRKRLFMIRNDGYLYYYPNENSSPKSIAISNIIDIELCKDNDLQFDLVTNHRTYHLKCETADDFMDWTSVMLCLISYVNDNTKNDRRNNSMKPKNRSSSIMSVFGLFSNKSESK